MEYGWQELHCIGIPLPTLLPQLHLCLPLASLIVRGEHQQLSPQPFWTNLNQSEPMWTNLNQSEPMQLHKYRHCTHKSPDSAFRECWFGLLSHHHCWSHLYCALPISLFPIYPCAHNALVIPCIRGSFGDQWKYSTLLCSIWEMSSAIWYNSHILSQRFTNLCTCSRRSQSVIDATPNDSAATIPPITNHYKDIIATTSHSHIPNDWFHQVMSREYTGSPPSISNGGVRICSACHNNLPLVIIICS